MHAPVLPFTLVRVAVRELVRAPTVHPPVLPFAVVRVEEVVVFAVQYSLRRSRGANWASYPVLLAYSLLLRLQHFVDLGVLVAAVRRVSGLSIALLRKGGLHVGQHLLLF